MGIYDVVSGKESGEDSELMTIVLLGWVAIRLSVRDIYGGERNAMNSALSK